MCHNDKVAKTNANKAQLLDESVERLFGIESKHFDSNHFNEVNKFIEDNHKYFYPPEVKAQMTTGLMQEMGTSLWKMSTLKHSFKLVKFLKRGKAPGPTPYTMRYLG